MMDSPHIPEKSDRERFAERACPSCGGRDTEELLSLTAGDFCPANETYRPNALELLGLAADDAFPIVGCRSCRFQFARLLPDAAFLDTLYERVIDDGISYANQRRWSKVAYCGSVVAVLASYLDKYGRPSDERVTVLDIGCGWGAQMEALPPARFDVVGLETSAVRRARLEEAGLHTVADLDEARRRGPFDFVICDNVLEHVPEPIQFLTGMHGLVGSGGALYAVVPRYDATRLREESDLLRRSGCVSRTTNPWEHLNYFSGASLRAMVARAGFEPVSMSEREDLNLNPTLTGGARTRNIAGAFARLASYVVRGSAEPLGTAVLARKPEPAL